MQDLPRYCKNDDKKLVAIAVPLSNREGFTEEEKISLRHLNHFLGKYDRYFIAPPQLNVPLQDGLKVKVFGQHYFGSVEAHRRLLFSKRFYQSFSAYEFLLIYHLDALVFSDQLEYWCRRRFDYIAPPWIPHKDAPYAGNPNFEGKVGNGGFSLRKVDSFLKVINSKRYWHNPFENLLNINKTHSEIFKVKILGKALLKFIPRFNGAKEEMKYFNMNEDRFWPERARHYYPHFKIAPLDEAVSFGFECVPRYCYGINNHKLPFGCHAWAKYDKKFWEPFLLTKVKQNTNLYF